MKLHTLNPGNGATHGSKRIGRGEGSGHGGTSTRGHKGAGSRAGYSHKRGFEGGQMPLYRRIPKFGFKNPFRVEYDVINLDTLQKIVDANPSVSEINHDFLVSVGLISTSRKLVKVLGRGELKGKLNVKLNKFSNTAKLAIEKAGGTTTES